MGAPTYDLTTVPNGSYQMYQTGMHNPTRHHAFSIVADASTFAAGESIDIVPIGAKETVMAVYFNVITASNTSSSYVEVGDSGSATRFHAGIAATATGLTWSTNTVGNYYASADAIRITGCTTCPTNGVFDVGAVVVSIPNAVY